MEISVNNISYIVPLLLISFSLKSNDILPPPGPQELLDDQSFLQAFEYYKLPYPDAPKDLVRWRNQTVYRPNHGLAHGGRKAALAIDSLSLLKNENSPMGKWIAQQLTPNSPSYNSNFDQQLAFAMLMLRTGRSSEKNEKYREDCALSADNFAREAAKSTFFPRSKDIEDIGFAMKAIGDLSLCFDSDEKGQLVFSDKRGCTEHRYFLYRFMYGVHHLDLRRMVNFSKKQIEENVASYLGIVDTNGRPKLDSDLFKSLWSRSGQYLALTGDRDMEGKPPAHRLYKASFFTLSNNPPLLRQKLLMTLQNSLENKAPAAEPISDEQLTPLTEVMKKSPPPYATPSFKIQNIIDENNIWFNYRARNEVTSKLALPRNMPGTHLPWTFKAQSAEPLNLFSLNDVVADRVEDNNKRYVKLYHGSTSDLLDNFMSSPQLRFDLGKGALGTGFYLTADVNEAMYYACERLKMAKDKNSSAQGMVLVFGVEESAAVKGKYAAGIDLSDPQTGESYDSNIFFKRNGRLYNQFAFFKNAEPFLKLLGAVILRDGFGISATIHDADGKPKNKPASFMGPQFRCNKFAPVNK